MSSISTAKKLKVKPVYNKETRVLDNGDTEVKLFIPDRVTGEIRTIEYTVQKKVRTPKITGESNIGLSVESIRKSGHLISVYHYRAFYSKRISRPKSVALKLGINFVPCPKVIFLPKSMIRDFSRAGDLVKKEGDKGALTLLSCGGYTQLHITILDTKEIESFDLDKVPMNERVEVKPGIWKRIVKSIYTESLCSPEDHFCYKLSVKNALNRLMQSDADLLNVKPVAEVAQV